LYSGRSEEAEEALTNLKDFWMQRRPNQRAGKQPLEIQQRQGRSKISSALQTLILPTSNNVPGHSRYNFDRELLFELD
jgi:hypothetical protein